MSDLENLHRRYDGPIPEDDRARSLGLDPVLGEARGQARFWQDRVRNAWQAIQANTRVERRPALADNLRYTIENYQRAVARVRVLEDPASGSAAGLMAEIWKAAE